MAEDQQVGIGEGSIHPLLAALLLPGLVHHGDADALDLATRDLGEDGTQIVAVVVAVHAEHVTVRTKVAEDGCRDPVPRVDDEVGDIRFAPDRVGQSARTAGDVGVGDQQQSRGHRGRVAQPGARRQPLREQGGVGEGEVLEGRNTMSTPEQTGDDGIRLDPNDAPTEDTTVGDTAAADAEFEGRPLDTPADEPEETYAATDIQPESQGEDPVVVELGEEGEGDLSPIDV